MKLNSFLKKRDGFGHPVSLNFNCKGEAVTTAFGGMVTIFVKVVLAMYLFIKLQEMLTFSNTMTSLQEQPIQNQTAEIGVNGTIKFGDTGVLPHFLLRKTTYEEFMLPDSFRRMTEGLGEKEAFLASWYNG